MTYTNDQKQVENLTMCIKKRKLILVVFSISTLTAPFSFGDSGPPSIPGDIESTPRQSAASADTNPRVIRDYQEMLQGEREALERRERHIQQKLDEIQDESNCETADKLIFEERYMSAEMLNNFTSTHAILEAIRQEPRFLKLLNLKETADESKRTEIASCIEAHLNTYLNDIPLLPTDSNPLKSQRSVRSIRGASVAALLLAEYDHDGSRLPFIARLHARAQEASLAYYITKYPDADNDPGYISSVDGAIFSSAEKLLLNKIKEEVSNQTTQYTFDARGVLEEFGKLEFILDEATSGMEGSWAESTRDMREQSELYRISTIAIGE